MLISQRILSKWSFLSTEIITSDLGSSFGENTLLSNDIILAFERLPRRTARCCRVCGNTIYSGSPARGARPSFRNT